MTRSPGFSTIATTQILELGFLTIQTRTIEAPSGEHVERIVIVHPGAVAVVPMIGNDVILIEQFRAAAGDVMLEIPAGKIDDPRDGRIETAHRELQEETGFVAGSLELLTDLWTSIGFSDERITIYLANDLSEGSRAPMGSEEEEARIVRMPFDHAVAKVMDGEIADAKTVAGLLITARRRDTS